jgi:hypothetical protein
MGWKERVEGVKNLLAWEKTMKVAIVLGLRSGEEWVGRQGRRRGNGGRLGICSYMHGEGDGERNIGHETMSFSTCFVILKRDVEMGRILQVLIVSAAVSGGSSYM